MTTPEGAEALREALEQLVNVADNVAHVENTNSMDYAIEQARAALSRAAQGATTCAAGHTLGPYDSLCRTCAAQGAQPVGAAVLAEREACAKIAQAQEGPHQIGEGTPCACGEIIAAAIRARDDTPEPQARQPEGAR